MVDRRIVESTVVADGSLFGLFQSADLITEVGFDLDFSGGEISLEVLLVIIGIPKAPLYIRKHFQIFDLVSGVDDIEKHDFACLSHGNEIQLIDADTVFRGVKAGISHAVTALVTVKFRLGRLPAGIPDCVSILYIYVLSVAVVGNIIVTISCNAQKPCIFIKRIAAACVGDQRKEVLVAQIVDPGKRSLGSGDDILPVCVIEISEFHNSLRFRNLSKHKLI